MNLGPESERPTKSRCRKGADGKFFQERVKVTDEEWREHIQREQNYQALLAEKAKTKHLDDREAAYREEVYPMLDKALAMKELDGDPSLMDELKAKRQAIKERFPEP